MVCPCGKGHPGSVYLPPGAQGADRTHCVPRKSHLDCTLSHTAGPGNSSGAQHPTALATSWVQCPERPWSWLLCSQVRPSDPNADPGEGRCAGDRPARPGNLLSSTSPPAGVLLGYQARLTASIAYHTPLHSLSGHTGAGARPLGGAAAAADHFRHFHRAESQSPQRPEGCSRYPSETSEPTTEDNPQTSAPRRQDTASQESRLTGQPPTAPWS